MELGCVGRALLLHSSLYDNFFSDFPFSLLLLMMMYRVWQKDSDGAMGECGRDIGARLFVTFEW